MRLLLLLLAFPCLLSAQQAKTAKAAPSLERSVEVYFFSNYPFCYKDNSGQLTGIEIDIFAAFRKWVAQKKKVNLKASFKAQDNFESVFEKIKAPGNGDRIGMASITIRPERQAQVDMTAPYMKNKSLLISNGEVRTLLYPEDLKTYFAGMKALAIKGSVHEKMLQDMQAKYLPALQIEYRSDPIQMLQEIAADKQYFCYTDIATYWTYLRQDREGFIKIHKALMQENEYFAFVLPQGSKLTAWWNEFLEGGFGFASTAEYSRILEKHLGPKVSKFVELSF